MNSTYPATTTFTTDDKSKPSLPKNNPQVLEQASLVGASVGTVVAALSQQILFVFVPFSVSLLLVSQSSRRRSELEKQLRLHHQQQVTITELQTSNQSLTQQIQDLATSVTELQQTPHKYLTTTHLAPVTAKLRELQRQDKKMELGSIATLTAQVEELQQEIAALKTSTSELTKRSHHWQQPSKAQKPRKKGKSSKKQPHRSQGDRVAIFIDAANLYHTAKSLGVNLNYQKLLSYLQAKSSTCHAYFYTGVNSNNLKQKGFLARLNRNGYQVISKEVAKYPDGSRKANLDVELSLDLVELAETDSYDTAVLVSGDGDFKCAIEKVQAQSKRVEVASFSTSTSKSLTQVADAYLKLEDILDQIGSPERSDSPVVVPLKQYQKSSMTTNLPA